MWIALSVIIFVIGLIAMLINKMDTGYEETIEKRLLAKDEEVKKRILYERLTNTLVLYAESKEEVNSNEEVNELAAVDI